LGCTDSYITHLENEVKLPSLDICMALAEVFQLTPAEQQELLEEVEALRRQRTEARLRTRDFAVRGGLRRQGTLARPPAPTSGAPATAAERPHEVATAASIASDLADNPALALAYDDLKTALADPQKRATVLQVLRALAQPYEPPASVRSP